MNIKLQQGEKLINGSKKYALGISFEVNDKTKIAEVLRLVNEEIYIWSKDVGSINVDEIFIAAYGNVVNVENISKGIESLLNQNSGYFVSLNKIKRSFKIYDDKGQVIINKLLNVAQQGDAPETSAI